MSENAGLDTDSEPVHFVQIQQQKLFKGRTIYRTFNISMEDSLSYFILAAKLSTKSHGIISLKQSL